MYVKNYINSIKLGIKNSVFQSYSKKISSELFFEKLIEVTKTVKDSNSRIFFFGNGASASFSNHMALDWSKNGGVMSFSLSDSSMLTALSNDYSFNKSFLEFYKMYSPKPNDLIVTTSSSGNSNSISKLLKYGNQNQIKTLAFSGLNESNFSTKNSDLSIFVPCKTYGMVECIHQIFHHLWLDKFMNIQEWNRKSSQNMDSKNFKI